MNLIMPSGKLNVVDSGQIIANDALAMTFAASTDGPTVELSPLAVRLPLKDSTAKVFIAPSLSGGYIDLTGFEGSLARRDFVGSASTAVVRRLGSVIYPIFGEKLHTLAYANLEGAFLNGYSIRKLSLPESLKVLEDQTFRGCYNISAVDLVNVNTIGPSAFMSMDRTTGVYGSNVTNVGDGAFNDMDSLETICLPQLETVGKRAFANLPKFQYADFPNMVTLDEQSFYGCPTLRHVRFSDAVESIPTACFAESPELVAVDADALTSVGCSAFMHDVSLATMHLANCIRIDKHAFDGCHSLNHVTTSNVTSIGDYAFRDCWALESFDFESAMSIGEMAFANCSSLTTDIVVNASLEIGKNAFLGCTGISSVFVPNKLPSQVIILPNYPWGLDPSIIHADDKTSDPLVVHSNASRVSLIEKIYDINSYVIYSPDHPLDIVDMTGPNQLDSTTAKSRLGTVMQADDFIPILGNATTAILTSTFSDFTGLHNIAIPETTLTLDESSFRNMFSLSSAEGMSVSKIGRRAFNDDDALIDVCFPECTTVGVYAFNNCDNLKSVQLPKATTFDQGGFQFANCKSLSDITLAQLSSLPKNSFQGCTQLTSFIGLSVMTVGQLAFDGCTAMEFIDLPELTSGPDSMFSGMAKLEQIRLPKATSLGANAFNGCTSLMTVSLPSLTSFGQGSFGGCVSVMTLQLSSMTSFDMDEIRPCTALAHLDINSVTSLDGQSFTGFSDLTTVDVTSLTSLPSGLFAECPSLMQVNCNSITTVGDRCFADCEQLSAVSGLQLASVGQAGFKNCYCIQLSALPEIQSVATSAFANCSTAELTSLGHLEVVPDYGFMSCSNGTFYILDDVTDVKAYGFAYACKLQPRTLSSLRHVGDYGFYCCESLNVSRLTSIATIGAYGFAYCTGLRTLRLPSTVESIGENAFLGCTNLKLYIDDKNYRQIGNMPGYPWGLEIGQIVPADPHGLMLGDDVTKHYLNEIIDLKTEDHSRAFWNDSLSVVFDFSTESNDNVNDDVVDIELLKRGMTRDDAFVPIIGDSIRFVSNNAFKGVTSLDKVTVSDKSVVFTRSAFADMPKLSSVDAPNAVAIGYSAFANDTALSNVDFPEAKRIQMSAFMSCTSLLDISLPVAEYAQQHAFASCYSLQQASFPVLRGLGESTFDSCSSLTSIVSPHVSSLPNNVFRNCLSLESLSSVELTSVDDFGATGLTALTSFVAPLLKQIGDHGLLGCEKLSSLDFPELVSAGEYAFAGCSAVTSIDFTNLTSISENTFGGLTELTSIRLPIVEALPTTLVTQTDKLEGLTADAVREFDLNAIAGDRLSSMSMSSLTSMQDITFGSRFPSIQRVDIDSLPSINDRMFADCESLVAVKANSAIEILDHAFENSGPTVPISIEMSSVEYIGDYAFANAYLTSIFCPYLSEIGQYSFYATALLEADLSSVACLSRSSFSYCTDLKTLNAPTMTTIDVQALFNCQSFTGFDFHDVVRVDELGCAKCKSIRELDTTSMRYIGPSAFMDCTGLTSLNFDILSTEFRHGMINANAFIGCTNVRSLNFENVPIKMLSDDPCYPWGLDPSIITGYRVKAPLVLNKAVVDQEYVTEVMDNTGILTPADVTKIVLCSNCETLHDAPFRAGFDQITTIDIPTYLTTLEYDALSGLSNLVSVNFLPPNSWTRIRHSDIWNNDEITGMMTLDGQPYVQPDRCLRLKGSYDPASGYWTDRYSTNDGGDVYFNQAQMTYSGELVKTGRRVLDATVNSESRHDLGYLESLPDDNIREMTDIIISSNVRSIGYGIFAHCPKLTSVTVDDDNPTFSDDGSNSINYDLYVKAACPGTTFNEHTLVLNYGAYYGAEWLSSLNISSYVSAINDGAFVWSHLESLSLGDSVTTISYGAFSQAQSLTSLDLTQNTNFSQDNDAQYRSSWWDGMTTENVTILYNH